MTNRDDVVLRTFDPGHHVAIRDIAERTFGAGIGGYEVTITVDAANERALGLYERTGLVRAQAWPRWSKPA